MRRYIFGKLLIARHAEMQSVVRLHHTFVFRSEIGAFRRIYQLKAVL